MRAQPLTSPKQIKKHLQEFGGIQPDRSLGQNFLVSDKILQQLIDAAKLSKDDTVIEPGAGLGTVTIELARRAGRVIAYELDPKLTPILNHNLQITLNPKGSKKVEIRQKDVLQAFSGKTLNPKGSELASVKIVGSIPYQITSPLIHEIIYHHTHMDLSVLILQKEVAEKITASSPQGSYLSSFVQQFAKVKLLNGRIAPSSFWPRPNVDSALIRLKIRKLKIKNSPREWSNFLHKGFAQPRKMLRKVFEEELLEEAEIDVTARPQQLSIQEWQQLFLLQTKK